MQAPFLITPSRDDPKFVAILLVLGLLGVWWQHRTSWWPWWRSRIFVTCFLAVWIGLFAALAVIG